MKFRLETHRQAINAKRIREKFKESGEKFKAELERDRRALEVKERVKWIERELPEELVKPIHNLISKIAISYPDGGLSKNAYYLLKYKAYKVLEYSLEEYALDNGCDPASCTEEGLINFISVMGVNEEKFKNYVDTIKKIINESGLYKRAKHANEKVQIFADLFDLALTKVIEQYEAHGMRVESVLEIIEEGLRDDGYRRAESVEQVEKRINFILQVKRDL